MTTTKTSLSHVLRVLAGFFVAFAIVCASIILAQAAPQAHAAETTPIYRLYNPNSGEHLFTKDSNEYNVLGARGWQQEGVEWHAPASGDPVYRLYNPYSGDHHYTTDANEYAQCGKDGWNQEGVKFYSDSNKAVTVYRLFNPYVSVGTHHYTKDNNEYTTLPDHGWRQEGVLLYGVDPDITYYADIEVKDYGTMTVALNEKAAPKTVENFVKLANKGFYDGLTFWRIWGGFMIQGGDPKGDGTGGSGESIPGEFSKNDYDNPLSHTRGTISMARGNGYNSASSQFFIVHQDSTYLDGFYAPFGHVTSGMEVVDKICEDFSPDNKEAKLPKDHQPVITSIKIRPAY